MYYILCKPLRGKSPVSATTWILSRSDLGRNQLVFRSPSDDRAYPLSRHQVDLLFPVISKRFPKYHVFLG